MPGSIPAASTIFQRNFGSLREALGGATHAGCLYPVSRSRTFEWPKLRDTLWGLGPRAGRPGTAEEVGWDTERSRGVALIREINVGPGRKVFEPPPRGHCCPRRFPLTDLGRAVGGACIAIGGR